MKYELLHQFKIPSSPQHALEETGIQCIGQEGISWSSFKDLVQKERDNAPNEHIKVLYLLRHGHGEHNDIPPNPMPHWSRLKGLYNPNTIDPALSQIGSEQISHLAFKLQDELKEGLLQPSKIFTSITKRTCQSAVEAWRPVLGQTVPIIATQDLRDTLCGLGFSRRGPLKEVKRLFPGVQIQEGTTETDVLWEEKSGVETWDEVESRIEKAFNDIWAQSKDDDNIGIVAHKDMFNALFARVLGAEAKDFQTAEMRVVIIKRCNGIIDTDTGLKQSAL